MAVKSLRVAAPADVASCLPEFSAALLPYPANDRRPLMSRQTFPRSARLLSSGDFKSVFDQALLRASHRHALVLARPNDGPVSRLGLVVAKKHVRLAVARNRIKRQTREYFRQHELQAPCDVVFLVRGGINQLSPEELRAMLDQLWQKLDKQLCVG